MLNLSRARVRQAIEDWLEAHEPLRARWLQEHPQRHAITTELTTLVAEVWFEVDRQRRVSGPPSLWRATPDDELEETILAQVLEAPELWPDLDDRFPRAPAQPIERTEPTMPYGTIPASGPTPNRSRPADN